MKEKVTEFYGTVNGCTFDNREAMDQYIDFCNRNNIEIEEYSYSTRTFYTEAEEETKNEAKLNIKSHCNDTTCQAHRDINPWPAQNEYKTVEDYLAPELKEEAFSTNNDTNENVMTDMDSKLKARMEYYSKNFTYGYLDKCLFNKYTSKIMDALDKRAEICNQHMQELEDQKNNYQKRIQRLTAEVENLEKQIIKVDALYDAYDNLGGYCTALEDVVVLDRDNRGL